MYHIYRMVVITKPCHKICRIHEENTLLNVSFVLFTSFSFRLHTVNLSTACQNTSAYTYASNIVSFVRQKKKKTKFQFYFMRKPFSLFIRIKIVKRGSARTMKDTNH